MVTLPFIDHNCILFTSQMYFYKKSSISDESNNFGQTMAGKMINKLKNNHMIRWYFADTWWFHVIFSLNNVLFTFSFCLYLFWYCSSHVCRTSWLFQSIAESNPRLFVIDTHALLNEKLNYHFFLYEPSKIINFHNKLDILR